LIAILPHDDGDRSIARDDLAAALGFAGSPRVNFEITHPESKSVRRARRCDAHVAASIVERRSKTFAHDDLESALIALSHATRAAEKFGVRFFDNSCTLCLTVSFSHP
jgi:hypothetical protein